MYEMRFPGEDISKLTMQQLRGREGARVRAIYRAASDRTGVAWNTRNYTPESWFNADAVNRALSAANACLYGICHAGIVALGCSPALGFVHTGKQLSFVYDIADLYKSEITIPAAFDAAANHATKAESAVRRQVRDLINDQNLLSRIARDLQTLFDQNTDPQPDPNEADPNDTQPGALWDPNRHRRRRRQPRRDYMIIFIVSSVPRGLRGHLSRWLIEPAAGVFIGKVSARVRELLWETILEYSADGSALMITPARNEQGYTLRSHGQPNRELLDFDGLTLIRYPS
jgi:CRISPR-associated endoribonuclease Cas2 subtype I-E